MWKFSHLFRSGQSLSLIVQKALRAKISSIWIKLANGAKRDPALIRHCDTLHRLVELSREHDISVLGWHVVTSSTPIAAASQARLVAELIDQFDLGGLVVDAESGAGFLGGGEYEAATYMQSVQQALHRLGKPVGLSSHDLPEHFPSFPFASFARHADFLAPQVYYGRSRSVANRFQRAFKANSAYRLPIIPIGAGWVSKNMTDGGCRDAVQCANRGMQFVDLVHAHRLVGHGFWVWDFLPDLLWQALATRTALAQPE